MQWWIFESKGRNLRKKKVSHHICEMGTHWLTAVIVSNVNIIQQLYNTLTIYGLLRSSLHEDTTWRQCCNGRTSCCAGQHLQRVKHSDGTIDSLNQEHIPNFLEKVRLISKLLEKIWTLKSGIHNLEIRFTVSQSAVRLETLNIVFNMWNIVSFGKGAKNCADERTN